MDPSRSLPGIICRAIVPGWDGELPPACFPRHVQAAFLASAFAFDGLALARCRTLFARLAPERREALIAGLAASPSPATRALVQWWKLVALVTDTRGSR